MNHTGIRTTLAGLGLAAACAAICCSAPLLVLVLPGLALLAGAATNTIEMGLLAAVMLATPAGGVLLVWRRRKGTCVRVTACGCGCRTGRPLSLGSS